MRKFFILIFASAALWAIDMYAFNGRYSQIVWQDAQSQGQQLKSMMDGLLDKAMSGR
jgi:hypothetical protein